MTACDVLQNLMHINADFQITRENFKAAVFRPGHRLPTMSLEEYADKEIAEAMERGKREKCVTHLRRARASRHPHCRGRRCCS